MTPHAIGKADANSVYGHTNAFVYYFVVFKVIIISVDLLV